MYYVPGFQTLIPGARASWKHLLSTVALFISLSATSLHAHAQDGAIWDPVFETAGIDGSVKALATDSEGNLYAGGTFTMAGGQPANSIARWDGTSWTALGAGTSGPVHALAVNSEGNVYAAGLFTSAGGTTVANIAKWDGATWSALGTGLSAAVNALAVSADGTLYAGGDFTTAGGSTANRIAKWDGTSWSALGAGTDGSVTALALDNGGNLFAGGSFAKAGGNSAARIAMWNGTSWATLGTGANLTVRAISVLDGSVYAGGDFGTIGGIVADNLARWDGTTWSTIHTSGFNKVYALAATAGKLYVGGAFMEIDGQSAPYIAMWDGESWSPLGSGMDAAVTALAAGSTSVFAGGDFTTAGGVSSSRIASWLLPADSHPASADPVLIQPVPSVETVTLDQAFSVTVEIGADTAEVANLFGAGFALHFDPALFQATTVTPGSFLDDGDLIFTPSIDNTAGTITVGVSRKRGAVAVGGHGAISRIDFSTIHAGALESATFSLSDVMLVDPEGTEISTVIRSGEVDITTYAVWPGDTDNDWDADISDVLPVGIHFGATGPARSDASFTWGAQTVQLWTPEPAMYADATGDGVVNQNDILPIGVNFGLNRDTPADTPALRAAATPLASLRVPSLPAGERFEATLSLESAVNGVDDLLGYAAELTLPASLKVLASRPGDLLENGDLLTLAQTRGSRYSVAHTRKGTDGTVSGTGSLLELSLEVTAPMSGPTTISLDALSLGTTNGIVEAGQGVPIALTTTLTVPNDSDTPLEFELHGTYPNPFTSRAAIAFDLPDDARVTMTIYDVLGREIDRIDAGTLAAGTARRIEIDASGLSSGTYLYRLRAEMPHATEIATGRFVLAR